MLSFLPKILSSRNNIKHVLHSGLPRAFGGTGTKLRNEASEASRNFSITPFRLAENLFQSIPKSENVKIFNCEAPKTLRP